MFLCYVQLQEHVINLDEEELDAIWLSPAVERKVDVLIKKSKELDEVTKKLQRPEASIRSARAYFDTLLEDYPRFSGRLDRDIQFIQNPHFQSELLKIQEYHEESLTSLEKKSYSGWF